MQGVWAMLLAHAANNWGLYNNLSWSPYILLPLKSLAPPKEFHLAPTILAKCVRGNKTNRSEAKPRCNLYQYMTFKGADLSTLLQNYCFLNLTDGLCEHDSESCL